MGDSGFRLVRQGKVKHKSTATMAGSSPRQIFVTESRYSGITFVDERLFWRLEESQSLLDLLLKLKASSVSRDIGRDSDLREFRVKKGDIIVMSSDGLFDVLRDSDIERIVNSHNPQDLQGIADELVALTTKCNFDWLRASSLHQTLNFFFQSLFRNQSRWYSSHGVPCWDEKRLHVNTRKCSSSTFFFDSFEEMKSHWETFFVVTCAPVPSLLFYSCFRLYINVVGLEDYCFIWNSTGSLFNCSSN